MGKAARRTALTTAAVTAARTQGGISLTDRIKVMPAMVGASLAGRWNGLGRGKLTLMALALLYLVSPVDLLPEAVLTIPGLMDDAVIAAWLVGTLLTSANDYAVTTMGAQEQPVWVQAERLDQPAYSAGR